jgi:hypothetical protein
MVRTWNTARMPLVATAVLALVLAGVLVTAPTHKSLSFEGKTPGFTYMGTFNPLHPRHDSPSFGDDGDPEGEGEETQPPSPSSTANVQQTTMASSVSVPSPTIDDVYDHGFGKSGDQTPPDGGLAVGTAGEVSVTNQQITFADPNGNLLNREGLEVIFSGHPAGRLIDPYVVYEPGRPSTPTEAGTPGEFWLTVQNNDHKTHANMLVAVSPGDNITGDWRWYQTDLAYWGGAEHQQWCDYDKVGIDATAVYLTCVMHPDKASAAGAIPPISELRVFLQSELVNSVVPTTGSAVGSTWSKVGFDDIGTSTQAMPLFPAAVSGPLGNGEFIVSADGAYGSGSGYSVRKVTHAERCCDGSSGGPKIQFFHIGLPFMFDPSPDMPQPDTTVKITGHPTKIASPVVNNGTLSFVQNVACGWSGGQPNTSCIQFVQVKTGDFPNSMPFLNQWRFGWPYADAYVPAIAARPDGWKVMVFARSSATEYPSAWVVSIPPARVCHNCASPPVLLAQGAAPYLTKDTAKPPRIRWGDYFTAAPSLDGTHIWVLGERTKTAVRFDDYVGRVDPAPTADCAPTTC